MTDAEPPDSPDHLSALLDQEATEETAAWLEELTGGDTAARKRALRIARSHAEERPAQFEGLADPLATFLTDADRAVRLTTAKLFVTLARAVPDVVSPVVNELADRLADDGEFYFVRARCAEALGYVAASYPEAMSPAILADLRLGLEFDEPEVKAKLAKALDLPTFEYESNDYIKRLTLLVEDGVIRKVYYPVFPPHLNPTDILGELRS
jgi:hypothetical protein